MTTHEGAFADALEQLRQGRGLSPAELARELDEYEGNISRWRRGRPIDLLKVWKLADFFGVDRNWLQALAGYPASSTPAPPDDADLGKAEWNALYDRMAPETRGTVIPMVRAAANASGDPAANSPAARLNTRRGRQQPPFSARNRGFAGSVLAFIARRPMRALPVLTAATG
jgi:transcriptional regulator with XRE-family HTH domain